MKFRIETESGLVLDEDLDERAPCVRLEEGRIKEQTGQRPTDLLPGQWLTVVYPLICRKLTCRLTRTDGMVAPIKSVGSRRPRSLATAQ